MNLWRLCSLVLLLMPLWAQADEQARGRVFLDLNGNGRLDRGELGVAEVKVSNGREVVRTDAAGRYRIALREGDTLFVIKPPTYRFPINAQGLPAFWRHHFPKGSQRLQYGQIEPVDARRSDFALLPGADAVPQPLELLLIADSQVGNPEQLEFYRRSIIAPASRHSGLALGITLGDLVDDALDLYPALNQVNAALGIPWLHAPGNHDVDRDAVDDSLASLTYRRHFGPDTVAWELPGFAFVALDDVVHLPGQKPAYIGGLREDQFEFLEHYLATLAPETRVVLSLHIPLFDDRGETFRHADRARLFALLQGFREPLVLSGHTHSQRHHFHDSTAGWYGETPLHEYNVGAACGGFWGGLPDAEGLPDTRMSDGSPNGYAILRFENDGYQTRYYASRGRDELRLGLTSPGTLRRGAYPAFPLLANVYAAEPDAQVDYRIDGGDWLPMRRSDEPDPELVALNVADRQDEGLRSYDRAVLARPTQHLWAANVPTNLAVGEHDLEVRVRSRFEGELRATTRYRLLDWAP